MARIKIAARKNTGCDLKRQRLAESDSPTPSEEADYYRDNFAWEWVYVMVTLIDVGCALREDLQSAEQILDVLTENNNAYEVLDYNNMIDEDAHIFVGKQKKQDETVDVYIMIGVMIDVNSDDPTIAQIRNGINIYLAQEGQTMVVRPDDICIIRENEENERYVEWNQHIIEIMDDNVESGNAFF